MSNLLSSLNGAETRTLLWTNPSPTSNFVGQTIPLDLSNFDEVEVEFYLIGVDNFISPSFLKVNRNYSQWVALFHQLNISDVNCNISVRRVQMLNSGVEFSDNHYKNYISGGLTVDNSVSIPYKIYGIKTISL